MVKVRGYLGQRGPGYEAVVDVPPALRTAVGRKRLRKGLDTRDVHVAKARLPKALLELNARIDAATRKRPSSDPLLQEAMALKEHLAAIQRGDPEWVGTSTHTFEIDEGERVEIPAADLAADLLRETIQERAEAIAQEQGESRARDFADMAQGRVTPLAFHMETWLAEPGPRGKRHERTKAEYRSALTALGSWLVEEGHVAGVERITRRVAGQYVTALHNRGLSASRIRDIASALSGYWQWMERKGIAREGSNPWPRQAPRKAHDEVPQEEQARAFTEAEVRTLLDGTRDPALSDLMRVAALTGMRVEEICQLTVGQCAEGVFTVARGKTASAARRVPIHPDLAPIVARRRKDQPDTAWLFPEFGEPNQYGKRSPNAIARFHRYRVEMRVHDQAEGQRQSRVNFHSWRRWFITEALRAGQLERVVKQVVGHKLPKANVTLGVYFGGDTLEMLRACVEAVKLPAEKPATEALNGF